MFGRVGLRGQPDRAVVCYAQQNALCLLTADHGFGEIHQYPPADYAGLIVLKLPRDATAKVILSLLQSLLDHPEIVSQIPGKLALVEFGRVRLRTV